MDAQSLLAVLNAHELTFEANPLVAWEIGAVSSQNEVASFMYRGGRFPPQASTRPSPTEDHRPEKKYWDFVSSEMRLFLCTDDKKYRALWKQIAELQKKSTTAIVGVIAAFLGASVGAPRYFTRRLRCRLFVCCAEGRQGSVLQFHSTQ